MTNLPHNTRIRITAHAENGSVLDTCPIVFHQETPRGRLAALGHEVVRSLSKAHYVTLSQEGTLS